jgi:hypothetical protein
MNINLASTRLAFMLLVLLALLILLSAVVPQRGIAQDQILDWRAALGGSYIVIEKLGLDRIYTSPIFLGTVALLSLNLFAGNIQRIGRFFRISDTHRRIRLLGSILFHFSLLLIVAGATLNHLYRFRVVFGLTEGQQAMDLPRDYFRDFSGPLCRAQSGRFTIKLERIHPKWQVGEVTTEAAEIGITGTGESTSAAGIIRVNHPLHGEGLEFHLGSQIGYSPELTVFASDGSELFHSFVRLARRPDDNGMIDADFVFLPQDSTRIELRMVTDHEDGEMARTQVTVERDGQQLYSGYPGPAGADLPDGQNVAVPRLRRWCYVEAIRNPFMQLVFTGFWIALAGLAFTLAPRWFPRRGRVA